MADIAPEIYAKIKESFDRKYAQAQLFGGPLSDMVAKINNGTATFQDANIYATMVGGYMADAMKENLILDELPGKRLYNNIAKRTIGEGLKDTYGIVSAASKVAQEEHNAAAKIGLKPVQPKLETDRVDKIVNKAVKAETQEALNEVIDKNVSTFARQVVDDTQKANARLHNKVGLKVTVEREYDGVGLHDGEDVCDWCLSRAGKFDYEKAMDVGAFERHEGCGCIIDYTSAKGVRSYSVGKYDEWKVIKDPEALEERVRISRELGRQVKINSKISSRNNVKGNAKAIHLFDVDLNNRQENILSHLTEYDASWTFKKDEVNMQDLAALTAKTGDEFALFTRGSERLVIRGDSKSVNVNLDMAKKMAENGYRWSGHTHPGDDFFCLIASGDDYEILKAFGQKQSVTYNSVGDFLTYSL